MTKWKSLPVLLEIPAIRQLSPWPPNFSPNADRAHSRLIDPILNWSSGNDSKLENLLLSLHLKHGLVGVPALIAV
jgi:hypothetical protein